MKKITSLLLALLMILPSFVFFAYANGVEATSSTTGTHEGVNIAGNSTLNYFSLDTADGERSYVDISVTAKKTDYTKVVDGDTTTGTNTGRKNIYAFELTFDTIYYFTDVVLYLNGNGTLPDGSSVSNSNYLDKLTINMYKAGELVKSVETDTLNKTEVSLNVETAADTIEIYRDQSSLATASRGNDFLREIETYQIEKEFCNVVKSNIASEALVYAAGTNEGDYCDTWWAWTPKALVDGSKDVGTRSPKGWNYSVFLDFTKDYLISELVLTLNGKGELAGGGGSVAEVAMNISQIRVRLFNMDGEQVYDSKAVSVDSTTVKLDPFVEACRVKIEIANGKGEGSEFMWEIETYVEEGNHVFEQTDEQNPTCNRPGYIEYTCHCGKVIKKTVNATGFHSYDDGVVTTPATETENGVLTKTCVDCLETAEFDIPATGHNWNAGVTTAPTCESDGSTVYTCTGCSIDGCTASYTSDIVTALGHDWNDGVVTKKASTTENGEKEFTCLREECGKVETRQTRKLQYTDSTTSFVFDQDNITVDVFYNTEDELYDANDAYHPLLEGDKALGLVDDDHVGSYWYGPTGSTYTITLDREYIFTKGTVYAAGNNVTFRVEWIDADGNISAAYNTKWNTVSNGADPNNPISVNMTESISSGAKAKQIKVTLTGAKWANGHALTLHGFDFVVHDCVVDESDYILSGSSYKAPTCTADGSCLAKCPVCENQIPVVLPSSEGHNVTNITTDIAPTCSSVGYGHGTCTKCSNTIYDVKIPALGKHVYDKEIVFMAATCGSKGIKQMVCSGCNRVGSQAPIEATGEHTPDWVEDYCSTYTNEGKEVFVCTGCGLVHEDNGVSERQLDKKVVSSDFVTLVEANDNGNGTATLTFKIDLDELDKVEYECDVRIITIIEDANGNLSRVESYGKYSQNMRQTDENGQVSSTIYVSEGSKLYTFVRLMNFRGVEFVDIAH
ncbi:MAG: hypothetical protein IJ437_05715 [Clostridia bacterium]|nr:hypothetical protein [Clostridia bacterium]